MMHAMNLGQTLMAICLLSGLDLLRLLLCYVMYLDRTTSIGFSLKASLFVAILPAIGAYGLKKRSAFCLYLLMVVGVVVAALYWDQAIKMLFWELPLVSYKVSEYKHCSPHKCYDVMVNGSPPSDEMMSQHAAECFAQAHDLFQFPEGAHVAKFSSFLRSLDTVSQFEGDWEAELDPKCTVVNSWMSCDRLKDEPEGLSVMSDTSGDAWEAKAWDALKPLKPQKSKGVWPSPPASIVVEHQQAEGQFGAGGVSWSFFSCTLAKDKMDEFDLRGKKTGSKALTSIFISILVAAVVQACAWIYAVKVARDVIREMQGQTSAEVQMIRV